MLVLPRITAPAPLSLATATASVGAIQFLKAGEPQVVGRPATLNDSLTVIGTPSRGRRSPRARAASATFAASRARPKSRTTTALIGPSRASMRATAASQSSTALTSRPARAVARPPAVAVA